MFIMFILKTKVSPLHLADVSLELLSCSGLKLSLNSNMVLIFIFSCAKRFLNCFLPFYLCIIMYFWRVAPLFPSFDLVGYKPDGF